VGQVIFTIENGAGGVARTSPERSRTVPSPAKPSAPATPQPQVAARAEGAQVGAAPVPASPAPAVPSESAEIAEFKLPELGENVHQGDLVRLMISPGAQVSEGQSVMEIETDKAVVEVPSSLSGIVKDVLVSQGEKIKVGQVVFTLEAGATSQPHAQHPSRADGSHDHERSTFQAAMQSAGRTEEQALPPDPPRSAPIATFSMTLAFDR